MSRKRPWFVASVATMMMSATLVAQTVGGLLTFDEFWGPFYQYNAPLGTPSLHDGSPPQDALGRLRKWNEVAINASGVDHTPVSPGEPRVFGEQIGPGRSSRAMAIVHIAIADAVNAIAGSHTSYTGIPRAPVNTSMDMAIAQAAHDTLVAMFPSQAQAFDEQLAADLAQFPSSTAKSNGVSVGRQAAAARSNWSAAMVRRRRPRGPPSKRSSASTGRTTARQPFAHPRGFTTRLR